MGGVRGDSRHTNPVHGVLLSACPEGDEVERSSTSGDVEGWPGRPQREMIEIYACPIRLSNTAVRVNSAPIRVAARAVIRHQEFSAHGRDVGALTSVANRSVDLWRLHHCGTHLSLGRPCKPPESRRGFASSSSSLMTLLFHGAPGQ